MSVFACGLAFHEQPWEESCILHFDDNRVKIFGSYRGSPSLRPQKSFRRSGASSPIQCLSTPFRRLNGSRIPPSGKSTSGVCPGLALGGLALRSLRQLLPRQASAAVTICHSSCCLPQATGIRSCVALLSPSSSVQLRASMSLQRWGGIRGGCCGFPRDKASSCTRYSGEQQSPVAGVHRSHPSLWGT